VAASAQKPWLLWVGVLLSVLFRLPILVNAGAINSDAAIVGLQARHMLAGEWSREIWRAPYQLPIESFLLMPFSALFGTHPFWIFLIPLIGMLAMLVLVWHTLRKHFSQAATFVCILPLIFATHAINSPMVYVMRQTMITCMVLGVFLLNRASTRSLHGYFFGGLCFAFGAAIDMFGMLLLPAGALLLLLCARDPEVGHDDVPPWRIWAKRLSSGAAGFALSLGVAAALGHIPGGKRPAAAVTSSMAASTAPAFSNLTSAIARDHALTSKSAILTDYFADVAFRAHLFWHDCLPFALGTKAYVSGLQIPAPAWTPPGILHGIAMVAALAFAAMMASAFPLFCVRRVPRALRRLGLFGALCGLTAIAAFIFVAGASDMWSARYLAPLIWFSPFSIAPALYVLGDARGSAIVTLWAACAAMCGWVTYGDYVHDAHIAQVARATGEEERALALALRARGITGAYADYWLAYRLSLLMQERPVVVPFNAGADRYPPYRLSVASANVAAMLFHPMEPRTTADAFRSDLRREQRLLEDFTVGDYTVLVVAKPRPSVDLK
jgi:hypothetical protein